VGLAKREQ